MQRRTTDRSTIINMNTQPQAELEFGVLELDGSVLGGFHSVDSVDDYRTSLLFDGTGSLPLPVFTRPYNSGQPWEVFSRTS